jgi:hypothetical protein
MTTSFQFPVSMNPSTRTFGPFTVPDDVEKLQIAFANWPQANRTLAIQNWISYDGATWEDFGSMNPTPGGRTADPRFPATGTDCSMVIGPMNPGVNRRLQFDIDVVGGQISTLATVTLITFTG